ncbi:MAG TPA: hypothetical protein EYQ14_18450 [Gammaproteobacteria bacterium]|nr:hypothetical protein [Gammaproteobacteria bacterium]
MSTPNTPILVGIGQLLQRTDVLEDAKEPIDMMLGAVKLAEQDTGVNGLLPQVQSVRVIRGIWSYQNPARYIAEMIGSPHAETAGTLFGGNQIQSVVNHTAASILAGDLDLVLITGAENGRSAAKARKAGIKMSWKDAPGTYDRVFGALKSEHHEYEIARGISRAIQIYPMYDNARRYQRGESLQEHIIRISELWARFSEVATSNPHAWIRDKVSAEEIRTSSPQNRPISFPYTKLMNSNMSVDMAGALIMCSVGKAKKLGIAEDLWVYPWSGVEGQDHFCASVRDNFYTSPGVRLVGQCLLDHARLGIEDLDYVDLYSCFPSAVQIAAEELGLKETDQLTVTGGLTFGGGPLNNYVMHSIARMVELLRDKPGSKGLITANGGNLYKHAHCIYSAEPPVQDFVHDNAQSKIDELPSRVVIPEYSGSVEIESYTVMYTGNEPNVGHFACLTPKGERTWINTTDKDLMQSMTREEFCGRPARINNNVVTVGGG